LGDDIQVTQAVKVADLFEHIGETIQTDLVTLSHRAFAQDISVSKTMRQLLAKLGDQLSLAMESAIQAVVELDQNAAEEVLTIKRNINHLLTQAEGIQAQAMAVEEWVLETMRIEMTLLENFKRVYRNLVEISNQILPDTTRGKVNFL
jgi:phosphate:Na+ symporter